MSGPRPPGTGVIAACPGRDGGGAASVEILADRAPRLVKAVELAPLLEERRLGRVQVLRLARADHAAAEPDHVAARIENREHHAVTEPVVTA